MSDGAKEFIPLRTDLYPQVDTFLLAVSTPDLAVVVMGLPTLAAVSRCIFFTIFHNYFSDL